MLPSQLHQSPGHIPPTSQPSWGPQLESGKCMAHHFTSLFLIIRLPKVSPTTQGKGKNKFIFILVWKKIQNENNIQLQCS